MRSSVEKTREGVSSCPDGATWRCEAEVPEEEGGGQRSGTGEGPPSSSTTLLGVTRGCRTLLWFLEIIPKMHVLNYTSVPCGHGGRATSLQKSNKYISRFNCNLLRSLLMPSCPSGGTKVPCGERSPDEAQELFKNTDLGPSGSAGSWRGPFHTWMHFTALVPSRRSLPGPVTRICETRE